MDLAKKPLPEHVGFSSTISFAVFGNLGKSLSRATLVRRRIVEKSENSSQIELMRSTLALCGENSVLCRDDTRVPRLFSFRQRQPTQSEQFSTSFCNGGPMGQVKVLSGGITRKQRQDARIRDLSGGGAEWRSSTWVTSPAQLVSKLVTCNDVPSGYMNTLFTRLSYGWQSIGEKPKLVLWNEDASFRHVLDKSTRLS